MASGAAFSRATLMRVVADTNVLISALMFAGVPGQFLDLAMDGVFTLVTSEALLDELNEKLCRKFSVPPKTTQKALDDLRQRGNVVHPALSSMQSQTTRTITAFLRPPSQAELILSSAATNICCGLVRTNLSLSSTSGNFLQLPDCERIDSVRVRATRSASR